jgi:hypothetical protein
MERRRNKSSDRLCNLSGLTQLQEADLDSISLKPIVYFVCVRGVVLVLLVFIYGVGGVIRALHL